MGHIRGSSVMVPSGYTITAPPLSSSARAATRESLAREVPRYTGTCPIFAMMVPTTGTRNSDSLARNRGMIPDA